jgi:transposase
MRTPGTAAELERRRRRAVALLDQGEAPTVIARVLGVHRTSLYRWRQQDRGTVRGRAAQPHPGRAPRLDEGQLVELESLLFDGPQEHGWPNQLWTAGRVTLLIQRHFGITFHPEHVRKILKHKLGWTSQKPQRRARERNDLEIERWKGDEFPRIVREAWVRQAHLVFLDESGFQLTPTVRRTLSPRGATPLHHGWDRHDRISAISCLTVSPRAGRLNLYFELLPDNATVPAQDTVAFLQHLKRHLPGPLTIVWDRGGVHDKSLLVRQWLAAHPEVVTEKFPGYAPELNPDALVWGYTKYSRLANLGAFNTEELRDHVVSELIDLRHNPRMLASFINHVNLPLRL